VQWHLGRVPVVRDDDDGGGCAPGALVALSGALLAAGFATGLLAGLLGIGGGILVPVLYEVFGALGVDDAVRMHLAVGTSLAVIVPTSLRSFAGHRARGAVDMGILKSMALPVVAGVALGAVLARYSNDAVLKAIWVAAAAILSLKLLLGRQDWRLGDEVPGQPFRALYGGFVGLVSTLMSIGGGVFITALMTLYGQPMQRAVATSSGFGPIIAIPGALGFVWAWWHAGRPAARLARLREPAGRTGDHPGQRAGGAARRAHRPRHLAAQAGAGVRDLPPTGRGPLPVQPDRIAPHRVPGGPLGWANRRSEDSPVCRNACKGEAVRDGAPGRSSASRRSSRLSASARNDAGLVRGARPLDVASRKRSAQAVN
jgi:uncharacterized protein